MRRISTNGTLITLALALLPMGSCSPTQSPAPARPAPAVPALASASPSASVTPSNSPAPPLARPDGKAPRRVLIPGGRVLLGEADRGPQRAVDVASFLLDVTEVTAGQFEKCINAGVCRDEITITRRYPNAAENGDMAFRRPGCTLHAPGQQAHPITCVTWTQAQTFCAWAEGRLPSIAEWMLAATGTEGRKYPWGNTEFDGSQANLAGAELRDYTDWHRTTVYYATRLFRDDVLRSAPVGSFLDGVSPEGVYDLYGNALEWLADVECAVSPCESTERATRGSSWLDGIILPLQIPESHPESYGDEALGFRCAASFNG